VHGPEFHTNNHPTQACSSVTSICIGRRYGSHKLGALIIDRLSLVPTGCKHKFPKA
jgi:hypothetical protein